MKTILVDAYNTFVLPGKIMDEKLHELLEQYPNKKIILTNANDEQMIEFGLDKVPYPVFTLKHDPDKIDPVFYRKMLEHYGLKTNEVIYFEHSAEAVKSAESIGIKTFHFDKVKRDYKALKEFIENNL